MMDTKNTLNLPNNSRGSFVHFCMAEGCDAKVNWHLGEDVCDECARIGMPRKTVVSYTHYNNKKGQNEIKRISKRSDKGSTQ